MVKVCQDCSCHCVLEDSATFCSGCGSTQPIATACPDCTVPTYSHFLFCSGCGLDINNRTRVRRVTVSKAPVMTASMKKRQELTLVAFAKDFCESGVVLSYLADEVRTQSTSLLKLRQPKKIALSYTIWETVRSIMGDDTKSNLSDEEGLLLLVKTGLMSAQNIRDEILVTVTKQLNQNTSASAVNGWQLLDSLLMEFGPANTFVEYFATWLQQQNSTVEGVSTYITSCQKRLQVHLSNQLTQQMYMAKYYDTRLQYGSKRGTLIPLEQLLFYSEVFPQPLQKLRKTLMTDALKEMKHINRTMHSKGQEGPKVRAYEKMLVIVKRNPSHPEFVDEVFCQLMRQATFAPTPDMQGYVLELFAKLLKVLTPTPRLKPYLRSYIGILHANPNVPVASRGFVADMLAVPLLD